MRLLLFIVLPVFFACNSSGSERRGGEKSEEKTESVIQEYVNHPKRKANEAAAKVGVRHNRINQELAAASSEDYTE